MRCPERNSLGGTDEVTSHQLKNIKSQQMNVIVLCQNYNLESLISKQDDDFIKYSKTKP